MFRKIWPILSKMQSNNNMKTKWDDEQWTLCRTMVFAFFLCLHSLFVCVCMCEMWNIFPKAKAQLL